MGLEINNGGHVQALTPQSTQTVSVTSSSNTTGSPVGARVVRVVATTDCHLAFGASPSASTSDFYLPFNVPEYVTLPNGTNVAVIRNSSDGTLFVTDMA